MVKAPKYSSFEEMPVWKLAYDFALHIYDLTKGYPQEEKYGLTSDTRRAATSVPANIAEAFGRHYYKDKLNFYYNARGSVTEVLSHVKIAEGVGYLPKEKTDLVGIKVDAIWKELNKIITTLSSKRN